MADLIAPDFPRSGAFGESGKTDTTKGTSARLFSGVCLIFGGWAFLVIRNGSRASRGESIHGKFEFGFAGLLDVQDVLENTE